MGMKIGKQKEKLSVEISFQLRIFSINKKFHILNLFPPRRLQEDNYKKLLSKVIKRRKISSSNNKIQNDVASI